MKRKILLSAFLATATWSLPGLATADWDTGPCPGSGTAPCIEAEVSGTTYHFNGTGDHAGEWHGLPTTGEDFVFSGATTWGCSGLNANCTWNWGVKIKKCQDENDDWRIGLQVNSASMTGGFICGLLTWSGFPWYSKDVANSSHCPFTDDCSNFTAYDATASSYTNNLGAIDHIIFGTPRVENGHLHEVVFNPGTSANLVFNSQFYDCDDEDQGCSINGTLTVTNATSLDIQ
ncbi:hypothetical protein ACLD0W_09730 [Alloalcanivorax sp. C16-1]|uniref:hypothetical protein n=1 Tax=Alloalcanivorax sp. C16-1 TaxID=3390051 RepID=UPI003970D0C6